MCPCWSCPPAALDRRTKTISRTITGLVADGACLQMGVGALPNLVCAALVDRNDLGIHTEALNMGSSTSSVPAW